MNLVGLIIGIVISAVVTGILIWIVSKIGLGLEVDGFGAAFIAGIAIAVVGGVITWLLSALGITIGGGLLGAVVNLLVGAVVLLISDRFVPGMRVKGFTGALVAALAIGVIAWLISLLIGAIGLA